MREAETIVTGRWRENCYVVPSGAGSAVLIDPGEGAEAILDFLQRHSLTVAAILATHAHYDHIASAAELKARCGVPFHLHGADARLLRQANFYRVMFGGSRAIAIPELDVDLAGRAMLRFGELEIDVMHTPGHTPGSVSFMTAGRLFCGDTFFRQRAGRTDLPGGDPAELAASVQRILQLPPATRVYPGHGAPTTLAEIAAPAGEVAESRR